MKMSNVWLANPEEHYESNHCERLAYYGDRTARFVLAFYAASFVVSSAVLAGHVEAQVQDMDWGEGSISRNWEPADLGGEG